MTQAMTDPFTMPQGLPTPEQKWWTATAAEIRRYKRLARALEAEGNTAQARAQEARESYVRLRQEYRDRWAGKRPEWATDAIYVTLPVAKDCIDDDQFYSRQAMEKYAGAQTFWARAAQLTTEMIEFQQRRKERLLAQVPQQREGSDG
jgi:hypothetical protein